jgi:ankyrin repeat protein
LLASSVEFEVTAASYGHSALHYAAVRGAVDDLRQLLSEGADIEARTPG